MKITLMRHEQSESNVLWRRYSEDPTLDIKEKVLDDYLWSLTDEGIENSQRIGKNLKKNGFKFNKFFRSPLQRTVETSLSIDLTLPENWVDVKAAEERLLGSAYFITPASHRKISPANFLARQKAPYFWQPLGGESFPQVQVRTRKVFQKINQESSPEDSAIVVTHDEFIKAAILDRYSFTPQESNEILRENLLHIPNGSIVTFDTENYREDSTKAFEKKLELIFSSILEF